MFRALVARGVYLALDNSDIQYAVKQLSERMSGPGKKDWTDLVKLAKNFL